jgi:hypothetical protein
LKINIGNCTQVTLTIQATSVPSGVSCTPLTASATVNAGQTAVLALSCSPAPSPTPQQYWTLNVNINDPYGAGYIITDNYGNSLQAARSLTTSFANYPSNVSSVTLNAKIQFNPSNMQCSISPSTVTVNAPSGGTGTVTQNFTVSCTQTSTPVSPYSIDVHVIAPSAPSGTCFTVTAKYSGTSVNGCLSSGNEVDLGSITLSYSPDVLTLTASSSPQAIYPSSIQVTTSDNGSTVYFLANYANSLYGIWVKAPSAYIVYKGQATIPSAFTFINFTNNTLTVSPSVMYNGPVISNINISVSPTNVTLVPGRSASFNLSADFTNVPGASGGLIMFYIVITAIAGGGQYIIVNSNTAGTAYSVPVKPWVLPDVGMGIDAERSRYNTVLLRFSGVSANEIETIAINNCKWSGSASCYLESSPYCPWEFPGLPAMINCNSWLQNSLPTAIQPEVPGSSYEFTNVCCGSEYCVSVPLPNGTPIPIVQLPNGIMIKGVPNVLQYAYVPGTYVTDLQSGILPVACQLNPDYAVVPGVVAQLQPDSTSAPVVIKPGSTVDVYFFVAITHDPTLFGEYYGSLTYKVVGQSGTVYASNTVNFGPYFDVVYVNLPMSGTLPAIRYHVFKVTFTMPNEPVTLTATAYATKPSETVYGMPSVFPYQLGSVTANFVPMQCQPYDNYTNGTVAMVPSGVFPQSVSDIPQCTPADEVKNVPAGTTTPSVLSNYATCVTYVPVNQWTGLYEIPCGSLTGNPGYILCNNAYGLAVSAPAGVKWTLKSSCGGEVSGVGSAGYIGLPINNGPPSSCSNPTVTFEVDPTTLPPECYALVFTNYSSKPVTSTLSNPNSITVDASTYIGQPCQQMPYVENAPGVYTATNVPTFMVVTAEPMKTSIPITAGCPQGTTLEDGASCGLSGNQCVSTPLGSLTMCCCAPKGANITIPSDMIIQVCPPGDAVPPTATNMVTADQANLALYCPSGGFVTTTSDCTNSGGTCTGTPTGENVPQYLLENLCCCQLPSAQVTCPSGTKLTTTAECVAVYYGTCASYPPNMTGYCCCSIPSTPPGPGVTVPTTTPTTTPTVTPTPTPTPTPTTPPTVTTCPSGTNLLPLGNCYMSNGTCVATPSGMSGVCCCKLPPPTVTPTPTPTVTVPVGVPAVSPVPTAVTPTPTAVTPTPSPPKVSKAIIGVIAGLAALGLAGGVYFAARKKKP